jgi:hypothetical protein
MQRSSGHEGLVPMFHALPRPLTGEVETTADPC